MKSLSLVLAALFCSTSPLLATEAPEPTTSAPVRQESKFFLGSDYVQSVRGQYASGVYQEFLDQMEADFQAAQAETQLEGLIQIRKEDATIAAAHSKDLDRWNQLTQTWMEERNKDLLKAVNDQSDSILGKKVHSISEKMDPDVEKALVYFLDLRKLSPGEGKNGDENRLIEIDLESEYKQIHLDSLAAGGQFIPDARQKHLVLRMEKMDQMLEASQSFKDQDLKRNIELLAKTADERYAQGVDLSDLNHLARGKIVASNEMEKKVASILSSYQGKFTDLTKEMFEPNNEVTN